MELASHVANIALSLDEGKFDFDLDDLIRLEGEFLSLKNLKVEKVLLYSLNEKGFLGRFIWPKEMKDKSPQEILSLIKRAQKVLNLIDDCPLHVECQVRGAIGPLGLEILAAAKKVKFLSRVDLDFDFRKEEDFLFFGGIFRLVKKLGLFNVLSFFFYKNPTSLLRDALSPFLYLEKSKFISQIILHFFLKKLFAKKENLTLPSLQNIDIVRDSLGKTRELDLEKLGLIGVEMLKK